MPRYVLKRIEFIEVFAENEDQALDKFDEGEGENHFETVEVYQEDD